VPVTFNLIVQPASNPSLSRWGSSYPFLRNGISPSLNLTLHVEPVLLCVIYFVMACSINFCDFVQVNAFPSSSRHRQELNPGGPFWDALSILGHVSGTVWDTLFPPAIQRSSHLRNHRNAYSGEELGENQWYAPVLR